MTVKVMMLFSRPRAGHVRRSRPRDVKGTAAHAASLGDARTLIGRGYQAVAF